MIKLYEKTKYLYAITAADLAFKSDLTTLFFMNEITHIYIYAGNTTKALKSLFALHTVEVEQRNFIETYESSSLFLYCENKSFFR